jgi:hypothetical protein
MCPNDKNDQLQAIVWQEHLGAHAPPAFSAFGQGVCITLSYNFSPPFEASLVTNPPARDMNYPVLSSLQLLNSL